MYLGQSVADPAYGNPSDGQISPVQQPSIAQSIVNLYGTIKAINTQSKLAKLNMQLAQQGQPPVTYEQIPGSVPTFAGQVGLDAQNQALLKWVLIGAGALALFYMMKK